jgi:hypothetical protein
MGEPVDYGAKFSYTIKEFFTFNESNRKHNGKYQLVILCVNCQPLVKVVRQYLINKHQDYVPQFRNSRTNFREDKNLGSTSFLRP